jgi:hypothetical protein
MNLAHRYLFHTVGIFNMPKILGHEADGFTYPPKEIVLQIFFAIKHPSALARFELANLESNGKYANH